MSERESGERLVWENDAFSVVVPYWAAWPFETLVLPRWHAPRLDDFTDEQCLSLAEAYQALVAGYDRIFDTEFPYSAGLHQAPADGSDPAPWQSHWHFYPPLLRSATVRKFIVGYEMLADPQRDITPEQAAGVLRDSLSRSD